MSILIKGMEMPDGFAECCIVIRGDGRVRTFAGAVIDYATAFPVPPHGRLIDADALIDWLYDDEPSPWKAPFRLCTADRTDVKFLLKNAPTIIPAEEGKT